MKSLIHGQQALAASLHMHNPTGTCTHAMERSLHGTPQGEAA